MKSDDTLIARIAEADPARRAGPSGAEESELAYRVRQRVRQAERRPVQHRPRAGTGSIAALAGSGLVVIAVVGLALVGHHPRVAPSTAVRPTQQLAVGATRGTFAALARPRTRRDRLPGVLRQRLARSPGDLPKLDAARSALVLSTITRRVWLVPAGRELCSVQMDVTRGRALGNGGYGEGCIGRRYADLHGLQLGVGSTTFMAVLPERASPVQVTFADGTSIRLHADANGVISHNFSKRARLISYTGPTGIQIHLRPAASLRRPPQPPRP